MPHIQNERFLVRRPCITYLRNMVAMNQLDRYPFVYWTCPPDPGKVGEIAARNMKLDGYEKGVFDMTIVASNEHTVRVFLIEFKHGKNGYTKEQKNVAEKAMDTPVNCLKIYSLGDFIDFVDSCLR